MNELMTTASELLMLGMGTVFVFLVVLIYATKAMSALVMRFADSEPVMPPSRPVPLSQSSADNSEPANPAKDTRLLKVITEAIRQHRES